MPRPPLLDSASPAAPLENLAARAGDLADRQDPLFEQSIAKALREQAKATTTQTEQAAGLSGSAQLGAVTVALLEQAGQAAAAAHSRRVENERAMLGLQADLLSQAGGLREDRYQTNLQHQQFLMQLKAQEEANQTDLAASVIGGGLTAFATGGFGGVFGAAAASQV